MPAFGNVASRRFRSAAIASAVLTATLFVGALAAPASADEHGRGHREWERHDWNRGYERHEWNREYYRAPPVVYGRPYYQPYYAPPVVYGPGFGLNLNIR